MIRPILSLATFSRKVVHKIHLTWHAVLHASSLHFTALSSIIVIIIVLASYASFLGLYSNKIYPHVTVGSTSIGSLTPRQATEKLQSQFTDQLQKPLTFASSERTWNITADQVGLTYNATASAEKAYGLGRQGTLKDRIKTQFSLITQGKTFDPIARYDKAKLDAQLKDILQAVEIRPISSKIDYVEEQFIVAPSVEGKTVDQTELKEAIRKYVAGQSTGPINLPLKITQPPLQAEQAQKLIPALTQYVQEPLTLTYEDKRVTLDIQTLIGLINYESPTEKGFSLSPEKVNGFIETFAAQIDRKPRDALFKFEEGRATAFAPSQDGIEVDRAALARNLEETILAGGTSRIMEVPVKKTPAKVTTDTVNELGIKELIGRGESNYRGSNADRVFNLTLATQRINGVLIAPGQEFSFNDSVGLIEASTGYKQALVILSGKTVLGDGGGVCQVSTTVFRAALNAGFPITQRYAHAYRVSYYENDMGPGFDSTIYQPGVDLKFKNDTGHYVLLQAYTDPANTKLYVDFYGTSDGRKVELSKSTYLSTTPAPPDVHQEDPNLPKGVTKQLEKSIPGAKVAFTRTVTRNGETIINETFTSNFRPWAAVYLVGTKEGT